MVFIAAGLGGGTGTGAAPVVAKICKEMNILTVAVVTKPFSFEGKRRKEQAEQGLEELRGIVDTVISIPNDKLTKFAPKNATVVEMFRKADEILHHSVKGISDLIFKPGLVNLDFADVKTIMSDAGIALMGIGTASGETRASEAAEKAISHPLLDDISIKGATGILVNITSSENLAMSELTEAMDRIYQDAGENVNLIWGQAIDDNLEDEIQITVIATGIESARNSSSSGFESDPFYSRSNANTPTRGRIRPATSTEISEPNNFSSENVVKYRKLRNEPVIKCTSKVEGQDTHFSEEERSRFSEILDKPAFYRNKRKAKNKLDVPTFLRKEAD
jgi:cell division protein FtsZ